MGTNPYRKRLVLLLWVLVTIFYFYLSRDYIRATMNDRAFRDYLDYVVQVAATQGSPPAEIRDLLLVKAEDLRLPVRGDQISIKGRSTSLAVTVNYQIDIEVPVFERVLYTKQFIHEAKYRTPY